MREDHRGESADGLFGWLRISRMEGRGSRFATRYNPPRMTEIRPTRPASHHENSSDVPAALPDASVLRSFRFFVATQFLGAFNDNLFKQLVLLLAVDLRIEAKGGPDYQAIVSGLFAAPFVLFSGFAGSLADRIPKTRVIVWAKVWEVAIMALGALSFWFGSLPLLMATVFLMGTQSAFFGPAKYGILPEFLPASYLPRANGVVLTTTFLAIILGMVVAGITKDLFEGALWWASVGCLGTAGLGVATSTVIRPVAAAQPSVALRPFGELGPVLRAVFADRRMLAVFFLYSLFWFVGGVMTLLVNEYGKELMGLSDTRTSFVQGSLTLGLAVGGYTAGRLMRGRLGFGLTVAGGVGVSLVMILLVVAFRSEIATHFVFFGLGVAGSVFGLPLQTYVQRFAPPTEKGRFVAALNFSTWVFILLSAGYFFVVQAAGMRIEWMAVPVAATTLLCILLFTPRQTRA